MSVDFAALVEPAQIRAALDQLVVPHLRSDAELKEQILTAVDRMAERLNTARRTAWVAVPVEAELVDEGDLIVQKDGALVRVLERYQPADGALVELIVESGPSRATFHVPPDRPVPVLRRPTADALDILTRQLGAQVK